MKSPNDNHHGLSRRAFIGGGLAAGAALALAPGRLLAEEKPTAPDVWVIHGAGRQALAKKCLEIITGDGDGLGKGARRMTLKVNAGWARRPQNGATTHPELVEQFLKGSREAGIRDILVPEHPCDSPRRSFTRSGLKEAIEAAEGRMIDLKHDQNSFRRVRIPKGKRLKEAEVASEFLDTDVLVNMPVAKHHSNAVLSIGMKNWMGAVLDRGYWHRNDLHRCIADFATFIEPAWTVIDATRIMRSGGPQGPSKDIQQPDLLIVSRNPVAADAYAATLFQKSADEVDYLRIAGEIGLGPIAVEEMQVHRVEL